MCWITVFITARFESDGNCGPIQLADSRVEVLKCDMCSLLDYDSTSLVWDVKNRNLSGAGDCPKLLLFLI